MTIKVIHAEVSTGILVDAEGRRILDASPAGVEFETEDAAREYALMRIDVRPDIECALQDQKGSTIAVLRNDAFVDGQLSASRKPKSIIQKIFGQKK